MAAPDHRSQINRHYAPPDLATAILRGLRDSGKDPERFGYDDLAPVDQFHTGGKPATVALARLAELRPGMEVLDVGGGLGGAARTLAVECGCRVTVLDLTEEYCRAGALLTERAGLRGQVVFHTGDALDMPFPQHGFDVVWSQHCTMNIDDKPRLYRQMHRVLRPGGRVALHEIVAGARGPIHFPVPWAAEPGMSFLRGAAELRALIEHAGFVELAFRDSTPAALDWFRSRLAAAPSPPPPLGLHLLLGARFRPAFENLLRNLEENRVAVVEAVYRRA